MTEPFSASPVVADSNLLLALVYPLDYSQRARRVFESWLLTRREIVAPSLWRYEATSALRKVVSSRGLSGDELDELLSLLFLLPVRTVDLDQRQHRASLRWAERLASTVAYDAAFVALAEELSADLWTADRRLAKSVAESGGVRVHNLLDIDPSGATLPGESPSR